MTNVMSGLCEHVFWIPPGTVIEGRIRRTGWYFWIPTGSLGGGPYTTEMIAVDQFKKYGNQLNKGGVNAQ